MKTHSGRARGLTLVETLVVAGVGVAVLGLILGVLLETGRATDRTLVEQQMRQEALVISQAVHKVARFRVFSQELAQPPAPQGGATEPAPASGGEATTFPASLALAASMTSPPAHAAPQTTAGAAAVSAVKGAPESQTTTSTLPPSVRPLFRSDAATTRSDAAARPSSSACESYEPGLLRLCSLAAPLTPLCTFSNLGGAGSGAPRHAALEKSPLAPEAQGEPQTLGVHKDKFQSEIAFRYAGTFEGVEAQWQSASAETPKIVEFTIRLWPNHASYPTFEAAQKAGQPSFQLTDAVRLLP